MDTKAVIKISVRNLIEFVMSTGDLSYEFSGRSRTTDAIKVHQKIQKEQESEKSQKGQSYTAEVTVKYEFNRDDITLEINGRIDGLIVEENTVTIDEIKTTTSDLDKITDNYNPLHWAQAKVYAYIYSVQNNIDNINVQLTYSDLSGKNTKRFVNNYSLDELKDFYYDLVDKYIYWAIKIKNWNIQRDASIKDIAFPFTSYRKGQREFAVAAYTAIKNRKMLFAQAPTGIGKTMASVFPTLKALGEGQASKIFYLTAKTITRTAAEGSFNKLRNNGLKLKTVTITAKDKICFCPGSSCTPDECEYARGYYDRVKEALEDALTQESFTREVIEDYAEKHKLCPFEFSLDLSNWSDCIICDYNYVFDPRVYLKRFFLDTNGEYIFLVDEAHNLVDRAREMFSAEIVKAPLVELKREFKTVSKKVFKAIDALNKALITVRKDLEEKKLEYIVEKEAPKYIIQPLRVFTNVVDNYLLEEKSNGNENGEAKQKLLDFYFEALSFVRTYEGYDERYITYTEKMRNDIKLKMFCIDPSYLLNQAFKRGEASIIFSATLSPIKYFQKILGGEDGSYKLKLESPFNQENLCVALNDTISTKYAMREYTYDSVSDFILTTAQCKNGNYIVFFPSYAYMNKVAELVDEKIEQRRLNIEVIIQQNDMQEDEREQFLAQFNDSRTKNSLIAFAVMGGIFGEGIDLVGERLIGAIIIGVGLPQLCLERNLIKYYFDENDNDGFEYAYIYPGINKVMQAAGRVIRTESDRGVILLIDDRFSQTPYRSLLPHHWNNKVKVNTIDDYRKTLKEFWLREIP